MMMRRSSCGTYWCIRHSFLNMAAWIACHTILTRYYILMSLPLSAAPPSASGYFSQCPYLANSYYCKLNALSAVRTLILMRFMKNQFTVLNDWITTRQIVSFLVHTHSFTHSQANKHPSHHITSHHIIHSINILVKHISNAMNFAYWTVHDRNRIIKVLNIFASWSRYFIFISYIPKSAMQSHSSIRVLVHYRYHLFCC